MKRIILAAVLAGLAMPALADDESWKNEPWRLKTSELLKQEKSVIDHTWSQDISLWVGRKNDGTRHDGFAEYICLVMHNQAGKPRDQLVVVHILDYAQFMAGEHVRLGKKVCRQ